MFEIGLQNRLQNRTSEFPTRELRNRELSNRTLHPNKNKALVKLKSEFGESGDELERRERIVLDCLIFANQEAD